MLALFQCLQMESGLRGTIKSILRGSPLIESVIIGSRETSESLQNSVTKLSCSEVHRKEFRI